MNTQNLPSHASVVVIGGGIMGCSTLYQLLKMGVGDAILIERNQLTSGTTWHSAAQVRTLRNSRNLTRMIQYSVDLYASLEEETGQAVGWIQKGSLSIATNEDRLIHIKRQEALAHAYGVNATSISAAQAAARWPLINASDVLGAVWSPDDGRVSPSDVCAALIKSARRHGAKIFEHTGVTGILTEHGRVRGVETSQGVVMCDAIALCTGLWSRELAAMAGTTAPLLACEHFYLLTQAMDDFEGNLPTLSDHDSHLYIRDDSGGLLVGCFEPMGKPIAPERLGQDFAFSLLPEDWDHFEPMMARALHRIPALASAGVKMLLNGPESFTPDGMFMLGETAETAGLFLGCGMNSVGIASAGGAGMNLAHCIVHGHTAYDLSEADANRFAPVFNSLDHLMARAPEILGTHYAIAYPGQQWQSARQLRSSPLDTIHQQHGAHFGQFYGWERPLYFGKMGEPAMTFAAPRWFSQVRAEVDAAHHHAALFDASSFGKIDVTGADAETLLLRVCAGHMARPPGTVIYTAMLNERGTYQSDLTVQRLALDHYRLFVGTNAVRRDLAWLQRHADGLQVQISDRTEAFAVIALMGPKTLTIAQTVAAAELADLAYFKHQHLILAGYPVRAARLSYVGEAGWELTCRAEHAPALYTELTQAGARPAGLFAQTAMRIEKSHCAMGHELDSDLSPVDVGLGWTLRPDNTYIGAAAVAEQRAAGTTNKLISLTFDDPNAVPIGHEPIYLNGTIIGLTTSCAYGFRVGAPIGLGHVNAAVTDGTQVRIDIGRQLFDAQITRGPLFDPSGQRMRPQA